MQKQAKKFILIVALAAYGFLGVIAAVDYAIDPFEVTGSGLFPPVQNFINQRVYKLRVIDRRHDEFNGYILGSSRAQKIHPEQLRHYLPGARFYNFSFTQGTLAESTAMLRYMLAKHYPVKYLLVELDIPDRYDQSIAESDPAWAMTFLPPRVVGDVKQALRYGKLYYAQLMFEQLWYKWSHRDLPLPAIRFDTSGVANWTMDERLIRENPDKFIRAHFPFARIGGRTRGKAENLPDNIEGVKTLVNLCRENGMTCVFFTPPVNQHNLDGWNRDYVLAYLRGVAQATNFWSFSDYNPVTLDDHNYTDDVHYRAKIIPLILARIFGDSSVAVPADFGVKVTKETYPAYGKKLRAQFDARDAEVPPIASTPPNSAAP